MTWRNRPIADLSMADWEQYGRDLYRDPPDGPPHDEASELSPAEVARLREIDEAIADEAAGWLPADVVEGCTPSEMAA